MGYRILIARLCILGAFGCGAIGLCVGLIDCVWKLGVTGWFTGGTLLAVLALAIFAEEYFVTRGREQE